MKFKNIYKESQENAEQALMALWTPGRHRMRSSMKELIKREPLMAEPLFQSIFPWENTTDPDWRKYLDTKVVDLQERKADARGETYVPFEHQTKSWKALSNGNSIVVTSGTGSGKTECFMLPVLSDLCKHAGLSPSETPVEAIFLYPLNALMQDQKERLGKACKELGLRFSVYNGSLEESENPPRNQDYGEVEVLTRKDVRNPNRDRNIPSCPHILLTNPSMLEYMLVRDADQEIFERSKGKLRWIIIDEAHTYSGSAAIELAYLIKRVLSAFGVCRDQVRFVCTSATIGDKSNPKELLGFIESIIGKYSVSSNKKLIHIDGNRKVSNISLNDVEVALKTVGLNLRATDVIKVRETVNKKLMTLESMMTELNAGTETKEDSLEIIDKLCEATIGAEPLLMIRGHFFMRSIPGLFACINEHCTSRLEYATGFNYLTTYRNDGVCPYCGAPLFEIVQCKDCEEFIIECEENDEGLLRPVYSNAESRDVDSGIDDDESDDETKGGPIDDNWSLEYIAWFGSERPYRKPRPDYKSSSIVIRWDGQTMKTYSHVGPDNWVMLKNKDSFYCPTCALGSGKDGGRFYKFRLTSDFLNETIAPALMLECGNTNNKWGKYIAFTDSRQGTAIKAKKFNIEAERAFARAKLSVILSTPKLPDSIINEIPKMMIRTGKSREDCIEECIRNFGGDQLPHFSIKETAEAIFDERIFNHIDYEKERRAVWGVHVKDEQAYKSCLIRSTIGRRPKYQASFEGLGIVTLRYVAIENTKKLPRIWDTAGFTLEDWKDFLKIYVDYVIRMGNHLQRVSSLEKQYLRDSDHTMPFNPDTRPKANSETGIVRLLCAALGIFEQGTLQEWAGTIDSLLEEAWSFLSQNILTKICVGDEYYKITDGDRTPIYEGWYYLDMSLDSTVCCVSKVEEAWICPVTNLVIDTIFRGYSPSMKGALCKENIDRFKVDSPKIKMPIHGSANFTEDVQSLERVGIWNNRLKYAFMGIEEGYLTAEHSGQQNRNRLDYYTNEFKSVPHRLNLLQCSTTMEMGVDIGDIDTVLMTNIPPHSANYMQRAGRAGRRGQSKAVSFSLCPDTAIGMQTFKDPKGIITGETPAIIPVESDIIIQRHINSFLIREFLCDPDNNGTKFSEIGPWLIKDNGTYIRFCKWLNAHRLDEGLNERYTDVFGARKTLDKASDICIKAITEIAERFQTIIRDIEDAMNATKVQEKKSALGYQGRALKGMDAKGYFAEYQFLPNAAMPTGVVEFKHLDSKSYRELERTKRELNREENKKNNSNLDVSDEDGIKKEIKKLKSKVKKLEEDSVTKREIKIALSEYAPGQTVVIDERNFVSAGIEFQNSLGQTRPFKYLYHCPSCGRYEYTADSELVQCINCKGELENILRPRTSEHFVLAIEPLRFRSDVNQDISRKEKTEKEFYDIQTILTDVKWDDRAIKKGYWCDMVSSDDSRGEIVFYNRGKGNGFTFCLDCGRMEVWRGNKNSMNWHHKDITHEKNCSGSRIYNNILISGRFPTSFVSLRFYKNDSGDIFEDDADLLYSLGVLLCPALAYVLGVSEDDLDFDIRNEGSYSSIFIYDTQKGGCGYSTRLLDPVTHNKVFERMREVLDSYNCHCENHITGACVNCLINRKSQRHENRLSKYKVLEWFNRHSMEINAAPQGSVCITTPLRYLLVDLYSRENVNTIAICVDARELNIGAWTDKNGEMGRIINECVNHNKSVKLIVGNIPQIQQHAGIEAILPFYDLDQKFRNWNIQVLAVESLECSPGKFSAIIVDDSRHYFTDQKDVLPFSEVWGTKCTDLFLEDQVPDFNISRLPDWNDIQNLIEPDEIVRTANISEPEKAKAGSLLSRVIIPALFRENDEQDIDNILRGKDVAITFNDSYVNSALSGLLLVNLIKSMQERYGFNISGITLMLHGPSRDCHNPRYNEYTYIGYNFPNEDMADKFINDLFEDTLNVTPMFSTMRPDHHRWLLFEPENESCHVEIRPDHGISGGWDSPARYEDLDFLDKETIIRMKTPIVYYLIIKKL